LGVAQDWLPVLLIFTPRLLLEYTVQVLARRQAALLPADNCLPSSCYAQKKQKKLI